MKARIPLFLSAFAALASLAHLTACNPTSSPLPGTSEGTFSVVGTLGTNTCGSGLGLASPWDFQIEMSEDGTTLYIAATDGSGQMSGTLSGTSVELASTDTSNVDTNDAGVAGPCDLTQTTTFNLDLSAAASPSTFSGSVTYTFAAATGVSSTVDCTDQLTSAGGDYATLPCSFTYSLSATH